VYVELRTIVRILGERRLPVGNESSEAHDLAHALAAAVVERRKILRLRQEDLADLADVSHRFVQALESGKATVRLDKLVAVLDALGLELSVAPRPRGGART
jgi:y4mF family transcriptional regulator